MDALFNLFKIKFNKLNELLDDNNDIQPNSNIVIYFNLEMVWKLFINHNNEQLLKTRGHEKVLDIVANIINIASHYRLYCKKHKLSSTIVLYTPSFKKGLYRNSSYKEGYRKGSIFKYNIDPKYIICQSVIRDAIEFSKTILEYVDDVHLIEGNATEPSLIPIVVNETINLENRINFIISNDIYDLQYANHGFYVFKPDRDDSILIRRNQIISSVKRILKVENNILVEDELYSFILSIIGDRNRSIDKIKGIGLASILKLIEKAKNNKDIVSGKVNSIELLIKMLKDDVSETVKRNFYCIDIDFQNTILAEYDRLKIHYQIRNRFDIDSLKKINDEYFTDSPINLIELNNIKQINAIKKRNIFK